MSESASVGKEKQTGLTWRQGLGLILLIGAGVGVVQFLTSLRGPTYNGQSVRQWLMATNKGGLQDSNFVAEVRAFGPESIPAFVRAFYWATNRPKEFNWFGLKPARKGGPTEGRYRADRALSALLVWGKDYPEQIEPVLLDMMKGPNRHNAIVYLGYLGSRHFQLLTNMVRSNRLDSIAALSGLHMMRTNAQSAVPLIVSEINGARGRDPHWYLNAAFALRGIGEYHPLTLPTLFDGLLSTNGQIHRYSAVTLRQLTNRFAEIRPIYLRLAKGPVGLTNGFDPGARPAFSLKRIGVPPEVGVPILARRLNDWMAIESGNPYPGGTLYALRALAEYGAAAGEAGSLFEERMLEELRRLADATNSSSAVQKHARNAIRQAEQSLKRMAP